MERRKSLSFSQAIDQVLDAAQTGETESVHIAEADGRYLAEALMADHPVPYFDRVAMDGYAIRSADTKHASFDAPVQLQVIEQTVGAGELPQQQVNPNQAMRIMTGASVPEGADAVIMLELTKEVRGEHPSETFIELNRPVDPGTSIAKRGEDTAQGTVLAEKGRRISAGEMTMLATFGYEYVRVYKQPVVGIFATGSELLPVGSPLQPGKIRNSNSYMLDSQIRRVGAIPHHYGILPDDFDLCYAEVVKALEEVDFLMTTGGAAVGDYDFVPALLERLGAELFFNKVAIRPGSVNTVGRVGEKWFFGLSGNPSACFVGFELFARPILKKSLGANHRQLPRSQAILKHDLGRKKRVDRFIRAQVQVEGDQVYVETIGIDKSGVASSLVGANALLLVPAGMQYEQGDRVEVWWLDRPDEGCFHV